MHNVHTTSRRPITQSPPQPMLKGSDLAINKHVSVLKPGPPSSLRTASAFSHRTWRCGSFGEGKQGNLLMLRVLWRAKAHQQFDAHLISPFLGPAPLLRWKVVRWRPAVHFLLNL